MASTTSNFSSFLFCLFIFSAIIAATATATEDMIHLHYYFHYHSTGPEANSVVIARPNGKSAFGSGFVFDGPLTEGPELSSKLVGRAQGVAFVVSMEDNSMLPLQNHLFVAGQYNGSTISIFGEDNASTNITERTVIGGSGQFRMARGNSIAKALLWNATYSLVEFDVYVIKHIFTKN